MLRLATQSATATASTRRSFLASVLPTKRTLPFKHVILASAQAVTTEASSTSYSTPDVTEDAAPPPGPILSEAARSALQKATNAVKRFGWICFWTQFSLSIVSGIILLFSVAFTSQGGPKVSLYLTLAGIAAGLLSTIWNFNYTRVGAKMQTYLDLAAVNKEGPKVKKQQVMDMLSKGVIINVFGLGSTLLGIQALVGMLVAKTLSNASAGPLLAASGSYNPVLALDVFLVQAATNTLLGHFLSLCCTMWLMQIVSDGRPARVSVQSMYANQSESSSAAKPMTA